MEEVNNLDIEKVNRNASNSLHETEVSSSLKTLSEEDRKWLTRKEAAEYLRISQKTLANLESKGELKGYRFNGKGRPKYLKKELDQRMR